jgi:hypothetical protein
LQTKHFGKFILKIWSIVVIMYWILDIIN